MPGVVPGNTVRCILVVCVCFCCESPYGAHPQELGVDGTPQLQTLKVEAPPARKAGVVLSSVDELVDKLKNEAKVL